MSGLARPLGDLQVVDVTTEIAGPYCTKLFADAGAEVVKLEPPGGDPARAFVAAAAGTPGDAPLFRFLNGGKRSVVGGLADGWADALLAGADLLVDDGRVDAARLRARFPHLVIVSITPYGLTGPYSGRPASDLTLQAESGSLQFRGPRDRGPVQAGGRIGEFLAGAFAAVLALAHVLRARSGGGGAHLDLSAHDVLAIAGSNYLDAVAQVSGAPPARPFRYVDTPGIEQAADGHIAFNANTGRMFQMFCLLVGRPDLMDDTEVASLQRRVAMGKTWQEIVDAWTSAHSVREIIEAAAELRIPVAPVHDGASVAADVHLAARGVFVRSPDGLAQPRPPYALDGEWLPVADAPTLGQHDGAALVRPPRPAPTAASATLPLAGLRVVDLTSWWAGGLCTQFLALLGADVVHVEGPDHPDGMRLTGHGMARTAEWWEWGHMFAAANTGKRGIAVDLGRDEGRELLRGLVRDADVFVENFAPRVVESWGLGEEAVRALNPGAVYVRMPGFGLTGPWRDRPAFAQIIEPMATMASITGFADGPPVSKGGLPDPVAGAHGAFATLVALAGRGVTGRGVFVESVMVEAALNVSAQPFLEHAASGAAPGRTGNRSARAVPQGVFEAGDGEWVALSVLDDDQWRALCAVVGQWAADPGLADAAGRRAHEDRIEEFLAGWVAGRDGRAAVDLLAAAEVPAGLCRDPKDLRSHPQHAARGLFEQLDHPVLGPLALPGLPCRVDGVERWQRGPAPTLGQHNAEVLRERLGLDDDRLRQLVASGVIGTRPSA
jgi:crotonobetainyl-CoA:carnitine CoA-transferase CaiB-like acyl-CoA transferase